MTEVAQLKLFTRREPDRMNLHSDYINDVLYSNSPTIEDPLMTTDRRIYDKVNTLGIRREEGLRRSPDVASHSEDVENIWEEEEKRDKKELEEEKDRAVGNDGNSHSRLHEAPTSSSTVGAVELGSDLDLFVETEFQFLDSDDEGEGFRSTKEVSHLGTLTKHRQTEVSDPSSSCPSSPLTNLSAQDPSEFAEEASSLGLDEPVVTSHRTSLPQEPFDVDDVSVPDLESPPIPAPPPLPPVGVLLAVNAKSATEQLDGPKTSLQSETMNGPETILGAANTRPKDSRPKNEPQSPQNVLFLELQGKLNRRLRKMNEDMDRNNETESSIAAAATAAPAKLTQEPLDHQPQSHLTHQEQTSTDRDHQLDTFRLDTPSRTEETGVTEKIDNAIVHGSETALIKDSSVMSLKAGDVNHIRDAESVEPSEIESSAGLLLADGGATEVEKESISRSRELNGRGGTVVDLTSQALHDPYQVEELEHRGAAELQTKHTEVEERLEVSNRKTVRTLIGDLGPVGHEQLLQPETEADVLHLTTSPASIPVPVADVVATTQPHSAGMRTSNEFIGSLSHPEITNPVVKRPEKQVSRPRPSSSSSSTAIHVWETPSGDEWTPQMDLLDDEFEDDFPQGIISRRHHQKRPQENTTAAAGHQRRPQKRTPSKLYQKKQLGGPQRPAPNPGAFSLARINRAVKRVFGSISSKPSSKQRTPISDSVFLQEDGWEIYPSRPYDQSNPGEPIKVVGVEKRPAYAYNAFTRQLVILPDHDRVLVTDDGRRIRDQDQQRSGNGKTSRPTSPGRNTSVSSVSGNREKPRFTSKSKASSPRPPNLNTKTVKSIHMQGRRESVVEDAQAADDAYWRRNSSPNFAGAGAAAASSANISKRKTSTLSKILSFRKSSNQSAGNGKKGTEQRLTASDVELMKQGGHTVRHDDYNPRQG